MPADPEMKVLRDEQLADKACIVIGTRPGIVMFSPIIREFRRRGIPHFVLHTGQHYSHNMDAQFLHDLELPDPDHRLEGTSEARLHGAQTAVMLAGTEEVLVRERPKLVLVGGDANTNLAAALAARKLHIGVAHVEAGERSYDWRMPEEHNRVVIDHISELLFATNEKGRQNLTEDAVRGEVVVTGNPIVDATRENLEIARRRRAALLDELDVTERRYVVATSHREENVDSPEALADILTALELVAGRLELPVLFAAHPRTRKRIGEFGLTDRLETATGVRLIEPQGYLSFLRLVSSAALVLTDSGGVQQEACILGVPAVTLRENTEWTETIELGANVLAGTDPDTVAAAAEQMLGRPAAWEQPFGDGRAAERIAQRAVEFLHGEVPDPGHPVDIPTLTGRERIPE